jgi:hypothetical protein
VENRPFQLFAKGAGGCYGSQPQMGTAVQLEERATPDIVQRKVVKMTPEATRTKCLFADGATILVSNFVACFIRAGDELRFPANLQAADVSTQIYIRNTSNRQRRHDAYQADIGYAAPPQKDKRGNLFVSASVAGRGIGIRAIHLPCDVLRDYFYAGNRRGAWGRQPSFYELLRVNASATPTDLRLAFKLRKLELRAARAHSANFARSSAPSISWRTSNSALATTPCLAIPPPPRCFPMAALVLC